MIQDSSLSRGHCLLEADLLTRVPELQTQLQDEEEGSVEPEEGQADPSTSKSTSPPSPNDLSSLNAITMIFKCTVCHDRLWYPEVLQHTSCRGKVNLSLAHYFGGYDDEIFDDGLEDAVHFYAMAGTRISDVQD